MLCTRVDDAVGKGIPSSKWGWLHHKGLASWKPHNLPSYQQTGGWLKSPQEIPRMRFALGGGCAHIGWQYRVHPNPHLWGCEQNHKQCPNCEMTIPPQPLGGAGWPAAWSRVGHASFLLLISSDFVCLFCFGFCKASDWL